MSQFSSVLASGFLAGFDYSLIYNPNSVQVRIDAIRNAPPVDVIPEPATWAMMLLGFGAIGSGMRRRRRQMAFAV